MERKYYLRGLGIGIVVTAIIMGIALSGDKGMTDAEIIARAKELGMVENTVLSDSNDGEAADGDEGNIEDQSMVGQEDLTQTPDTDTVKNMQSVAEQETDAELPGNEEADDEGLGTDSEGEAGQATANVQGSDSGEGIVSADGRTETSGENEAEESKPEDINEMITSAAVKTITVSRGDGSHTVAKKLADLGVVASAESFDVFLCEHGYDKRLRTGTFSIPADASEEQIARIVTGAE